MRQKSYTKHKVLCKCNRVTVRNLVVSFYAKSIRSYSILSLGYSCRLLKII